MMPEIVLKGAHLSFQQERLWSFQQKNQKYRSQCSVVIHGNLNFQAFEQSLQQIVERHTIFQTVFYALPGVDVPVQVLGHSIDLRYPIIDLEAIAAPVQSVLLETLWKSLQEEAFDLEHGPLFRPILFRLFAETALLVISLPALYADAATLPLLITDLVRKYTANLLRQESSEVPLQYTSVSAWQQQQMTEESEEANGAAAFWGKINLARCTLMQRKLEKIGFVENENLHIPDSADFTPRVMPLLVDNNLSKRIYNLAARYNTSMASVLLTIWSILLWRVMDEEQLVIGVACDGRDYEELADLPGLYRHFVPFDTYLENSWSYEQVLSFVEAQLQATKGYQGYFSWPEALNEANIPAGPGYFPIVFEQEQWPASFVSMDLMLQFEQRFCCTEPFVLKLGVLQVGERVLLELHYDANIVSSERVNHLAVLLQTLLHSIVERPEAQIDTYSLLDSAERIHLLTAFKAKTHSWPIGVFHQLFESQVQRWPDQLAVISLQEQLTYRQLNERANQLAQVLRQRGVGPNVLVGLYLPRCAHMLVGVLGILKAGGAYLPLDASSPRTRLSYQLNESQATLLLTQEELRAYQPAWDGITLYLEDLAQELAQSPTWDQTTNVTGDDLAYVIYTSGSTGSPKGVMVRQSSIVNYTLALCERLETEPGWQYATVSTLAADLGNTAIFCALASGGCVQVLAYETVISGEAMAAWARQHPIDVLKIVPSHLAALLGSERVHDWLPQRALVLGGEALSKLLVERVQQMGGTCRLYNHYGPTETTIGVLVNVLGESDRKRSVNKDDGAIVALGRPIANIQAYVMDRHQHLVPQGVIGELYIGGAGVARGYLGQAERTAERFIPHPYSEVGGERLYRTGDLAHYGKGDMIEFVGRHDGQVKLRGYRIELGEIESVLRQHPQIRDCVVMLRESAPGESHLVGYIVPRELPLQADMNIRDFIQERLPDYMLPSVFVYLKFLPLTANGKIDRNQLSSATEEGNQNVVSPISTQSAARKIIQPRDWLEMQLLQIWEDILPFRPVSIVDNFFDIGGHSLLAVRLMSHIAERFGRNLDLSILFQHPTIAELAVILRQRELPQKESLVVAIQAQGSRPPFFCVHPAGGTAFCYVTLARCLGPDQPFYGLHAPLGENAKAIGESAEAIAARYIDAIQTVQPEGPYFLGGWSLGGVIALEMAQQLRRQGHEISVLAIIDSALSDAQRRAKAIAEGVDLGEASVVKDSISSFNVIVPDDFDHLTVSEQFIYVVEQAKKTHAIPEDATVDLVRIFSHVKLMNKHIAHIYAATDYPRKIDYFLSGGFPKKEEASNEIESIAESAVWPAYVQPWLEMAKGGFEVHYVPGNHVEMVEEPNVQILAKALSQCIESACKRES